MEVASYLGKVVFNFDPAERLSDEEHRVAYIAAFQYVLSSARRMMDDVQRIELVCKHKLSCALLKEVGHSRRGYVYEIRPSRLWQSLSQLAEVFYFFEDHEVKIMMKHANVELKVLAVRHPIYFLIERRMRGSIRLVY